MGGSYTHTTGFSLTNVEAGLSSLGLPARLGGAGGSLAAVVAVSNLSHSSNSPSQSGVLADAILLRLPVAL